MSFLDQIKIDESNNLCIDFDGVIHSNELGYNDGTIYGTPIVGTREAIIKLSKTYNIIIFTSKALPDRPLVNGKTGIELIWEWLAKYDLDTYISEITYEKPRAIAYIDDKAIRFITWDDTLKQLNYEG